MNTQEYFRKHPVFRHETFTAFREANGCRNVRTREALLAYHAKVGHLLNVRRGLYAVVPEGVAPDRHRVDPYLLGTQLTNDAVLAYHSALQFHGVAYSIHHRFPYLTRHPRRPFVFQGMEFVAVPFPHALQPGGNGQPGVETIEHAGGQARVTGIERTLVDVLARPDLAGGWEEVWRSLEMVDECNLDQIVDYALSLRNATTVAKTGYFLEQHREALELEDTHLDALRQHAPRQPCYLDRRRRQAGKLQPDWQLVVPPDVLGHTWEEHAWVLPY